MQVFSFCWLVSLFRERNNFIRLNIKLYCSYRCFNTQNYINPFQTLSLGFILKIFLKFRKFQPWYSYKIYSYKKKRVYCICFCKNYEVIRKFHFLRVCRINLDTNCKVVREPFPLLLLCFVIWGLLVWLHKWFGKILPYRLMSKQPQKYEI